jgi:hypothetical protein
MQSSAITAATFMSGMACGSPWCAAPSGIVIVVPSAASSTRRQALPQRDAKVRKSGLPIEYEAAINVVIANGTMV